MVWLEREGAAQGADGPLQVVAPPAGSAQAVGGRKGVRLELKGLGEAEHGGGQDPCPQLDIAQREQGIAVVWLGGQPPHWPTAREFNLKQDVPAAQVVFDSGVPFVQIPCAGVASHLLTTIPEMEVYVKPHGEIGKFLFETYETYRIDPFARSKEIWDISATGWLIDDSWAPTHQVASPILTDQVTWSVDPGRHPIRIAHSVKRDAIFGDLFKKLALFADGELETSWV